MIPVKFIELYSYLVNKHFKIAHFIEKKVGWELRSDYISHINSWLKVTTESVPKLRCILNNFLYIMILTSNSLIQWS